MNRFRNDGSFLAQFSRQADQERGEERGGGPSRETGEQSSDGGAHGGEVSRARDREIRAGDWTCPKCSANVFASRDQVRAVLESDVVRCGGVLSGYRCLPASTTGLIHIICWNCSGAGPPCLP